MLREHDRLTRTKAHLFQSDARHETQQFGNEHVTRWMEMLNLFGESWNFARKAIAHIGLQAHTFMVHF